MVGSFLPCEDILATITTVGFERVGPIKDNRDLMSLTQLIGPGLWISLTAGPAFTWSVNEPEDGYSLSIGGGAADIPEFFEGAECNIDVDLESGDTTVDIPKIGVGFSFYIAVRFSGNCTGCGWNPAERWNRVWSCVQDTINDLDRIVESLNGLTIPKNLYESPGDVVLTFHKDGGYSLGRTP